MEQESSTYIRIYNWEDDKICLKYCKEFGNWEMFHLGDDEIKLPFHVANQIASYAMLLCFL